MRQPCNFPGLGDALIFFCLLFLYQDKKRRWGAGRSPTKSPPYFLLLFTTERHERRPYYRGH